MNKRLVYGGGVAAIAFGALTLWSLTAVFTEYETRYGVQRPIYSTVPDDIKIILGLATLICIAAAAWGLRDPVPREISRVCGNCRAAMPYNSAYCPVCGQPVIPKVVDCPKCHMPTMATNEYCPSCGERILGRLDEEQHDADGDARQA